MVHMEMNKPSTVTDIRLTTNLTHNSSLVGKKAEHKPQNNRKNVEFTLHFPWNSSVKL